MLEDIRKRNVRRKELKAHLKDKFDLTKQIEYGPINDKSVEDIDTLLSLIDKYKERTESVTAWLEHDEKMLSTELRDE